MANDPRPLRVGSPGSGRLVSKTRFTYPVQAGGVRKGVSKGAMSVEARIMPGFDRFIRDRGKFTRAQTGVNVVHGNMAFRTIAEAKMALDEDVKRNPRPNRTGREGLRLTLARRYEQLMTVTPANRANAGFIVDFNRLDQIGPFDTNGVPYWRFVESGFGGGPVKALFVDGAGRASGPDSARQFRDVAMPNTPKGASFEISGFPGYGFIARTLTQRAKAIRAQAFESYLWDIDWPDEVRDAAQAFLTGGSDRGGRVRSGATGRMVRDRRSF